MCYRPEMENDLKDPISTRHSMLIGLYTDQIVDLPCSCNGDQQPAAYRLYNVEKNVLVWNNCTRTLFASLKRHLAAVPLPEEKSLQRFYKFAKQVIDELPLYDFDYSFTQWFNHLTYKQQQELYKDGELVIPENKPCVYDMFCKREIQLYEEDLPKTRAICGPQPEDKLVLGPITWALEDFMANYLEGYCGGKNWDDLEQQLAQFYDEGYTVLVQGDGSGFDRTQSHELKEIDRIIYNAIADKVHHVPVDIFLTKANSRHRKIRGYTFENGKRLILKAKVDGTVMSGNPDTTLMNTVRMALYIRFMAHEAGIEAKYLAKGDDFAIFCRSRKDADLLSVQFDKYWSPKNANLNRPYGLGLVLKFLTIGDYTTFDFCSTHLICDFEHGKFKIVRQWDRIINQGAYSQSMLSMSGYEKHLHIKALCQTMQAWSLDMKFYKDYLTEMDQLADTYPSTGKLRNKSYPSRIRLPDDGHRHRTDNRSGLGYQVDRLLERKSTLNLDDCVEEFMLEKHGYIIRDAPWELRP